MNIKSIFTAVFTFGIIALSLLLFVGSSGAAPSEEWNKTFGGPGDDIANSVQQTSDGGYLISGSTLSQLDEVRRNVKEFLNMSGNEILDSE